MSGMLKSTLPVFAVVLYFLGAVITHLRGGDKKGSATPGAIMLLAVAPLVLGFATL
jgi:hypothetical protein